MRFVVLVGAIVAGCSTPITGSSNGGPDATSSGVVPHDAAHLADAAARSGDAGAFTCANPVTSGNANGHHNAGMDCMDGCHDHGFTLAGTLYTSSAGTAIVSGATVSAIDAFGNRFDMVAQTNGNFYTSFAITYPITIYASECPTIDMMSAQITDSSMIGCNKTGCHAGGSTQGRVHLP
jgi:hypothetical protein